MLSTSARRKPAVPDATNMPNGGGDAGGHGANGGAKFRERIHRLHVAAVSFPPKAVPLRAHAAVRSRLRQQLPHRLTFSESARDDS
jgi:hypothetical protein